MTICLDYQMLKNAHHNFPSIKWCPQNCFFCPTNSPKAEYSSFTIIKDKDKQQIPTFNKMEPAFLDMKMTLDFFFS